MRAATADETHGTTDRSRSGQRPGLSVRERLRRFLLAYWLRPENALWMTLRSLALDHVRFAAPSADISCGDGVFSFLHAGGILDDSFDVFCAVRSVDAAHPARTDMFDAACADYTPPVRRRPDWSIDVGTDLKPNLLAKARALRFYGRLIEHDNEQPLPLPDATFRTVYCNSAYWVRGIEAFLRELRRITHPEGCLVLHVKLAAMRDCTLERFGGSLGREFLALIGRGRLECWPTIADRAEWERRFRVAGLRVESAVPLATRTHAHIWDVGLRPFAPLLVRLAQATDPRTRLAIKRDWVALCHTLCEPLCRCDFDLFKHAGEPAEMQYVLRPTAAAAR